MVQKQGQNYPAEILQIAECTDAATKEYRPARELEETLRDVGAALRKIAAAIADEEKERTREAKRALARMRLEGFMKRASREGDERLRNRILATLVLLQMRAEKREKRAAK